MKEGYFPFVEFVNAREWSRRVRKAGLTLPREKSQKRWGTSANVCKRIQTDKPKVNITKHQYPCQDLRSR